MAVIGEGPVTKGQRLTSDVSAALKVPQCSGQGKRAVNVSRNAGAKRGKR